MNITRRQQLAGTDSRDGYAKLARAWRAGLSQAQPVLLEAKVFFVRSWDQNVYFTSTDGQMKGFALMPDTPSFDIAAAAQAANVPVFAEYEAYDPTWGNNAGLFTGVRRLSFNSFTTALNATLTGDILAIVTRGSYQVRNPGPLTLGLTFDGDRTSFTMDAIQLSGTYQGYSFELDLTSDVGSIGAPDAHGFRDMSAPAHATLKVPSLLISESCDLTLSTNATLSVDDLGSPIQGSAMNGHGYVTIVGEGTSGSDKFDVRLEGTLAPPLPWAIT